MKLKVIETFSHVWPQWATCLTVALIATSIGLMIGWTSPYLARLTAEDAELRITDDEASWIVSLFPFGRLFGATAGSIIMEYYGSKRSLLISGIPIMISWICIIFADAAFWLYMSRICAGITFGMFYSCFALYIGEIAASNIRGALVSTIVNGMPLGSLIGNVMGSYVSMMCFGLVSLILTVCFMMIFPLLPQSPYYYVRDNNAIEAKKTIQCGINTVTFYMEIIIRSAKVTLLKPATVVIISSGIGIVVGWISVYLIDRYGRRILMAVSCVCVIASLMLLGLHFMLLEQNFDPKDLEWLSIVAMILFMLMSIGIVPVPTTMLSELFPDDLKSLAGFTASMTSALFSFMSSRTYQPLVDLISEKYVFWVYAFIMILCLVYSIVEMPETKGKTLQEIQDMLASESKKEERSSEIIKTVRKQTMSE
ncbi:hypothetical protein QLX08_011518 [Tetragonisca angustula]|uniref:Major facilitator superfamily (MFS) profile domain-containing protein n=1 Tax=Tetragonisca angustula TaxID=166442 RepID=A0AAW0Z8Z7_9HYME